MVSTLLTYGICDISAAHPPFALVSADLNDALHYRSIVSRVINQVDPGSKTGQPLRG